MEQTYFDLMMTQACESINVTPVTEGIIDTILKTLKGLFDKAIEFLKGLWEAIKGFFSKIWNRAVEFFNKHFKNDKKTEPVEIALIGESFNIKKSKFESPSQFVNAFKSNCQKIQDKINKHSKENQDMMAKFKDAALKEAKKESWEYLEEKVVTHNSQFKSVSQKNSDRITSSNPKTGIERIHLSTPQDQVLDNSVYDGKNLAEHIHKFDINVFKRSEMEILKASKNILEAYEIFANAKIEKIATDTVAWYETHSAAVKVASENGNMNVRALDVSHEIASSGKIGLVYQNLMNMGFEESEIMKFLRNHIFPDFDSIEDPEKRAAAIRKFVQLKINWNKGLVNTLKAMLDINNLEMQCYIAMYAHQEGVSGKDANEKIANSAADIKKALDNDDFSKVKKMLQPIINDQLKEHPEIVDLRKFKLGVILFSDAVVNGKDDIHSGWYESIVKTGGNDKLLQYLTKYDVTVIAHGEYDKETKKWTVEKTKTPGGGAYDDAEELIRALIKQNFKRINIRACNPGGVKLPEDIQKNKNVVVYMSSKYALIN